MSEVKFARVAVPVPLFGLFDYSLENHPQSVSPGCRVEVSFGRKSLTGLVMEISQTSHLPANKIKAIDRVIDETPVLPEVQLKLLQWAADYYHHPIGEVLFTALPSLLKQGQSTEVRGEIIWQLTEAGRLLDPSELKRAVKQSGLLKLLQQMNGLISAEHLNAVIENWRPAMQGLEAKQLVMSKEGPCLDIRTTEAIPAPPLNDEQQQAVTDVSASLGQFNTFLLQGITGSGKTEVYLALVEKIIKQAEQVLVLVPEISLTPQLIQRFKQRLGVPVAALHSGLNDRQRLCAWTLASENKVQVVIGTRSALFTPLPNLKLIIIDEEHDNSLKQQEGFRYNARDLALVLARNLNIPVLLGSATPSLETLNNALKQQYRYLKLTRRASSAKPPKIELLNICNRPVEHGISDIMLSRIRQHLEQQGQVLLFLNRRGYAPLLMCHDCGWTTECPRCDAHMTLHHHNKRLQCHHCGHERQAPSVCPECGHEELFSPGAGTERIEQALTECLPDISISRIDRDTTRRKGELNDKLAKAHSGESQILIGTQMLAKGHDFPNVTLVGILNTDQGLFSADFRGTEHMAQLIIQVAGRAGRAEKPGEVLIQTHHPDHPLLQTLLHQGYEGFAKAALAERKMARFPPYAHLVVLRTEASRKEACMDFLNEARARLQPLSSASVEAYGPLPAPMEKRAGRYRAQLILQSEQRKDLHQLLKQWIPGLGKQKTASRVRWSLDIDPQDMY